jgi:hypothetical protein
MIPRKFKYASVKVSETIPAEGFATTDLDTTNCPQLVHLLNRVLRDTYPDGRAPFGFYSVTSSKKLFREPKYDLQFWSEEDPNFVALHTIPNRLT